MFEQHCIPSTLCRPESAPCVEALVVAAGSASRCWATSSSQSVGPTTLGCVLCGAAPSRIRVPLQPALRVGRSRALSRLWAMRTPPLPSGLLWLDLWVNRVRSWANTGKDTVAGTRHRLARSSLCQWRAQPETKHSEDYARGYQGTTRFGRTPMAACC